MKCRHCGQPVTMDFLDLGEAPPSNAYLTEADLTGPEARYPLRVKVCESCWLVQTEDFARRDELFSTDYAYFSSTSQSWLAHAEAYARRMTDNLRLGPASLVVEVASNDGYLLRNFVEAGIPCLGIEPTDSTAAAAERLGVPVRREFFGEALAKEMAAAGQSADLVVGNNVFAHVPDINDFTRGLRTVLKPGGTLTLEFPHVLRLIEGRQFDTVYHEHYSYLSLYTTQRIFEAAGLKVFDVEELPTHGGSLRVYGCHANDPRGVSPLVPALLRQEKQSGLCRMDAYLGLQQQAERIASQFAGFLRELKAAGSQVAAYGAAAKGNTLINFAGISRELLPWVADRSPGKQGRYLPGSHIPVVDESRLRESKPDYVILLPWNLKQELREQLAYIREWDGRFVTALPELEVE